MNELFRDTFGEYEHPDGIVSVVANLMSKDTTKLVKDFIAKVKSLTIPDHTYSYLDAVILNKKIYNLLIGRQISIDDNFDTITYSGKNDASIIDSVFTLIGQYVDLDIYKQTGVTYTEFKQMTVLEKNILLEHVNYKVAAEDYDYATASSLADDNNTAETNEYDLFK